MEMEKKARYQNSSKKSSWRQTVPFYKERNSIPENITLILTVLISTSHKDYFASSWVNFVSGVIKCNTCTWNILTNYLIKKNEKERSNTALCLEINHLGLRSSTLGRAYLLRMPQRWREDMRSVGKNWNSRTISNSKETQATFTR